MDFFRNLSEEGDDFPTTYSYSDEEFIDPEPPQGAPNCLQGRKIHFTGNFYGKSLDSMYELVTKYKGVPFEKVSPSSKFDMVVCGSKPRQATVNAAQRKRAEVLTLKEFYQNIKDSLQTDQ